MSVYRRIAAAGLILTVVIGAAAAESPSNRLVVALLDAEYFTVLDPDSKAGSKTIMLRLGKDQTYDRIYEARSTKGTYILHNHDLCLKDDVINSESCFDVVVESDRLAIIPKDYDNSLLQPYLSEAPLRLIPSNPNEYALRSGLSYGAMLKSLDKQDYKDTVLLFYAHQIGEKCAVKFSTYTPDELATLKEITQQSLPDIGTQLKDKAWKEATLQRVEVEIKGDDALKKECNGMEREARKLLAIAKPPENPFK